MNDEEIVLLFEARDEGAIREANEKYGKYCLRIAQNVLSDPLDAEECLNDAFLKAWNSIPPQRPKNLGAYLSKITRNLSINRYNEKTREKRGGSQFDMALDEVADFLEGTVDVSSELEIKEFTKLLNNFLRSLAERERSIFVLRYFHMESIADIAKARDLRESNVLMILSRVRKKLKETLERAGYTV